MLSLSMISREVAFSQDGCALKPMSGADLVENCARIAHEAVLRFDIPEQTT